MPDVEDRHVICHLVDHDELRTGDYQLAGVLESTFRAKLREVR
jgi:hypothetical protein